MKFKDLPELGGPLDGGIFAGLTTQKDGTHCAVVLLPGKGSGLNWSDAKAWAAARGGDLPSRPVAALLSAAMKDQLSPGWHWTSDEYTTSYAWSCHFARGYQVYDRKRSNGSAVAVRLTALEA